MRHFRVGATRGCGFTRPLETVTVLVVLPGLDGTATLHAAFTDATKSMFDSVVVIPYPPDQILGYDGTKRGQRELICTKTTHAGPAYARQLISIRSVAGRSKRALPLTLITS